MIPEEMRGSVLELHKQGHTYREIEARLRISKATAQRIVAAADSSKHIRARKQKKLKPLPRTASGDWFRGWLEVLIFRLPTKPFEGFEYQFGSPSTELIRWLSDETDVDEKDFQRYLTREKPTIMRFDAKGNPNIQTALKIAIGLRKHTRASNPLRMLLTVPDFKPHGWGVIGTICKPGPTKEFLELWPAFQWLIRPRLKLEEQAFQILESDSFASLFDLAWREWYPAERADAFAEDLRVAIEHARINPPEFWNLTERGLESWVDHVAEHPELFGPWMRQIDGRGLSARDAFEGEIQRWEKCGVINAELLIDSYFDLHQLIDSEREALLARVKEILASTNDWSALVTFFR